MFDLESYHKANTAAEAVQLLAQNPQAVPIAGGTDVLVRLHQGHADYRHLVDIHDVAELKQVTLEKDGTIVIGAGVTFCHLLQDQIIKENIPVLAEGASFLGGPQIRNMATVGGNICNGAPCADSAAPLLVLDAEVVLMGPQGERQLPLHEFYQGPGLVDRKQAEIMVALRIAPDHYQCWSASYHKYAMRDAMDIATIGCAAACLLEGGEIADFRMAFTVAGPTPLRCWQTEAKARGAMADKSLIELVCRSVLTDLRPRDSWRSPKAFREHIIQTLAERVLNQALQTCGVTLS